LLRHSAIDPVTGLHTQQYFQQFLEREWRRASRERRFVSVIMVEVDHFRAFTERHGKTEGDACLKSLADALKPLIHRVSDAIAQYGGAGKFGIVLGGTDSRGAMFIAERLRAAVEGIRKPNPASPTIPSFTATLGVSTMMPDREGAWQDIQIIASAERALARAREAGRNTVMLDTQDSTVPS
jgi:diguanylate cyclase (GGDEF)-like protein